MDTNPVERDELTGFIQREAFDKAFDTLFQRAVEKDLPFTLAFMDLDKFLLINENYGHAAGDRVLRYVAGVIRDVVGRDSVVARYGGDEFALLFPALEREEVLLLLEKVRVMVEHGLPEREGQDSSEPHVTISAGIATYPIDGQTRNELLRKADQAMYRAKEVGGNQIRLAYHEKMVPKTTHYTQTQLERLSKLAAQHGVSEADLLREALDNLLLRYRVTDIDG